VEKVAGSFDWLGPRVRVQREHVEKIIRILATSGEEVRVQVGDYIYTDLDEIQADSLSELDLGMGGHRTGDRLNVKVGNLRCHVSTWAADDDQAKALAYDVREVLERCATHWKDRAAVSSAGAGPLICAGSVGLVGLGIRHGNPLGVVAGALGILLGFWCLAWGVFFSHRWHKPVILKPNPNGSALSRFLKHPVFTAALGAVLGGALTRLAGRGKG
jgi:hypothetical protein